MTRVCIFGANIAWGAWDTKLGGWANRLKLYFFKENKRNDVYKLSVSGDTSKGLLKRFDVECNARKPNIIVFDIGCNDSLFSCKHELGVSLEDFKKNLLELVSKARAFTNKIVFVEITKADESKTMPIPWDKKAFYKNKENLQYNSAIKELCEKEKLVFVELFSLLSDSDLEDGLHPNSVGHKKIFEKVKPVLVEICSH